MRTALAELTVATFFLPCVLCAGQPPANLSQPSPPAPATTAPAASVYQILQPAVESVQGTLNGVHTDKWKKGGIRDEANQNISQIMRDVQENLPPLVRDADAAPGSVSKMLPVSRNVGALYDVLLRVVEASRVVAPDDQVAQLQQALVTLGNARLSLIDREQTSANVLEQQVIDLRAASQRQTMMRTVVQVPIVLPCSPASTRRSTRRTTKAPAKPAPAKNTNNTKPQQQGSH